MSLTALAKAIHSGSYELVSTDLFDTVLLRDHSIESERLAVACRRVAPLIGVDAGVLTHLRWSLQRDAYRAVAIERPRGEASLAALCAVAAQAFGLDEYAGTLLRQAEVDVEIEHLRPNRPLLSLFEQATRSGLRVVALSDTYLGRDDLRCILDEVVGVHPIAEVYSSADLGLTKHAGGAFAVVAQREQVRGGTDRARRRQPHGGCADGRPRRLDCGSSPAGPMEPGSQGRRKGDGAPGQDPDRPMSSRIVTAESFGREVLGPIFAEFCLRLWSFGALLTRPEDAALLFCARGGLRIQFGYETFLRASGLPNAVRSAPLMVSRLAAIRPALMRTVSEHLETLVPAASATLRYELPRASLSEVGLAMSGVAPARSRRWDDRFTPHGFAALLHHRDGSRLVAALAAQAELFTRHVRGSLDRRHRAVLVDTGLFGTTSQLWPKASQISMSAQYSSPARTTVASS